MPAKGEFHLCLALRMNNPYGRNARISPYGRSFRADKLSRQPRELSDFARSVTRSSSLLFSRENCDSPRGPTGFGFSHTSHYMTSSQRWRQATAMTTNALAVVLGATDFAAAPAALTDLDLERRSHREMRSRTCHQKVLPHASASSWYPQMSETASETQRELSQLLLPMRYSTRFRGRS